MLRGGCVLRRSSVLLRPDRMGVVEASGNAGLYLGLPHIAWSTWYGSVFDSKLIGYTHCWVEGFGFETEV